MSTADADEVVEVSEGGVTVRKTFAPDEFPVPAIRFAFETDHDDPVKIRLSENIPETFPMDGIGFHPDYHSDDWTAFEDHRVEFTGTLPADEEFVTVYGIRIDDDTDIDGFLSDPTIVQIETDGAEVDSDDEDAVDDNSMDEIVGDSGDAVKDMLSGESDTVPGLEDDDEAEDAEEDLDLDLDVDEDEAESEGAEPELELDLDEEEEAAEEEAETEEEAEPEEPELDLDLDEDEDAEPEAPDEDEDAADTDEADETEDTEADDADETASSSPEKPDGPTGITQEASVPEPTPEPVGERLVEEIQAGKLSDGDLEVLRDELEIEEPSVELAKVDHLQSRVEELSAYAGALEEFLDDEGTGAQLIEEFRGDLEGVQTRLEEAEERVGGVEGGLSTLEDQTSSLGDAIEETNEYVEAVDERVDEHVEALEDDIASVEDDVDDLEEEMTDLEEDVESLDETVTDIVEWRSELGSMFQGD